VPVTFSDATELSHGQITSSTRRRPLSLAAWLLIASCVLSIAWFTSRTRMPVCPYGQSCDRSALVHGWTDPGWAGVIAIAGALALGMLWRWDRRAQPLRSVDVHERPFRRGRVVAIVAMAVLVCGNLLLLSPKPEQPFCADTIHVNQALSYPFHCDSAGFLTLAHDPEHLLNPGEMRQSRPGYVVLAAAATAALGGVTHGLGLDQAYKQHDRAYIPLIVINFVLLIVAAVLLARLLARVGAPPWAVVALCAMVIVNDLTKWFLWTPHQQILALLVPVATMMLGWWVLTAEPGRRRMTVAGLLVGLTALCYGSVLITVAAVAIVILVRHRRAGFERAGLYVVSAIAPTMLWIITCRIVAGSYFNQEVQRFGEFIWPIVGMRDGSLGGRLVAEAVKTFRELFSVAIPAIVLIMLLAVVTIVLRVDVRPRTRGQRAILVTAALVVVLAVVLNWAIGFIAPRIMYHAVPPLLVIAGWLAAKLAASGPTGRRACAAVVACTAMVSVAVPFVNIAVYT
jgi:hypothetical protein